jgi:hypothetical protein
MSITRFYEITLSERNSILIRNPRAWCSSSSVMGFLLQPFLAPT